jgi:hypothetical protein
MYGIESDEIFSEKFLRVADLQFRSSIGVFFFRSLVSSNSVALWMTVRPTPRRRIVFEFSAQDSSGWLAALSVGL